MTDGFKFTHDPKQWETFFSTIKTLAPEVGQKAFASAMRDGAKEILERVKSELRARAKAPTGRLENALKVKSVKKYEPYFWKSSVAVPLGKKRDDESGAYYAHMVEFGHQIVDRTGKTHGFQPALNFMSAGLESAEGQVISDFKNKAKNALEKAWNRLPKSTRGDVDFSKM